MVVDTREKVIEPSQNENGEIALKTENSKLDIEKAENVLKKTNTAPRAPTLNEPTESIQPTETLEQPPVIALPLEPALNTNAIEQTTEPPTLQQKLKESAPCEAIIRPQFTADITDFSKIKRIVAPGIHTTGEPKGYTLIDTGRVRVPVYAPTTMTLETGIYKKDTIESSAYYLLYFILEENCDYKMMFSHLDEVITAIDDQLENTPTVGETPTARVRTTVTLNTGDLIGYAKGAESGYFDVGMYHSKEAGPLKAAYNYYEDLGYAVCWTDFYRPSTREQHYKNLFEGPQIVCFF